MCTIYEQYIYLYMYCIFFIHSSVNGHQGFFHVLAIVNSAAMNIGGTYAFLNYDFLSFPHFLYGDKLQIE